MTRREFGELESAIVKLLDKHKSATVAQMRTLLGAKDRYTTILTITKRLYDKGRLQRVKVGRSFEYSLKKGPDLSIIQRVKKALFGNSSFEMISYLLGDKKSLSASELAELEKLIKKARNKA